MVGTYRNRKQVGKEAGISEEELEIFGVTDAEADLLIALLELGPTRVSRLAREADMSHTTAHSALRRLRDQGLVRRVSKGYASVWKAVQAPKIRKKIDEALKPFEFGISKEQLEHETGAKVAEHSDFFIFEGIESILKAFQWLFLNHRGERIECMQSPDALHMMEQKLREDQKMAMNEAILANNVEVVAVNAPALVAGHIDINIAKDLVFVANWNEERLTMIKNPDVLHFFKGIHYAEEKHIQNN